MALYPFIEALGDRRQARAPLLDRPRNAPTRTAFGVAAMTCTHMFWIGGGNDLVATQFHVSLNSVTYFLRVAVFVVRSWRSCHQADLHRPAAVRPGAAAARRGDRHHRSRSVRRLPRAAPADQHQEEAYTLTQHAEPLPCSRSTDGADVSEQGAPSEQLRRRATRFWFLDTLRKPTRAELEEAAHHQAEALAHGGHHAIGDGHVAAHGNGHAVGDGNGHAVGDGNGHAGGDGNGHVAASGSGAAEIQADDVDADDTEYRPAH